MDGNARFELGTGSPDSSFTGSYQNGQRGYSAPSLGRSSSFRESADGRNFGGSAKANFRGNASSSGDVPSLSQCLMLDPIPVGGDQKNARTGELRRLLGVSVGSSSEENAFGAAHLKNTPPATVEELKRLRASYADTRVKATGRAKKLDEHLIKLNKLFEALPSKKQLHNELLTNERSSGPALKIGSLSHRNVAEPGNLKFDDRHKNGVLNKRLRTSMADTRSDSRSNGVMRQPMTTTKERDTIKDSNADSEIIEEKIRRLPAGGESWDRKMKRKRSVGAVCSRSVDNEGELKRTMHQKLTVESSMPSGEPTQGFRYGTSGGSNKLDPASSPVASTARANLKSDQEKYAPTRDIPAGPMKERALGKVNVRLNNRDDNHGMCPSPIVKGKASRTPRSGSIAQAANSPANIPRVAGTLESWEQTQGVNKPSSAGGPVNNRKRSMSVGSTSPPITQWVGQRPQKISRTRRTNLVPVSNNEEMIMQGEACSPSDFGPRVTIGGLNASLLPKNAVSESHNFKIKSENVPSPVRFSESEESGAAENRMNDKSLGSRDDKERPVNSGHGFGPSTIPMKKNKIMVKEQNGDSVKRQGHFGRASSFSRASVSPARETMDNLMLNKPLRNDKSSCEKNGSKSGRPLKKIKDRKSFPRNGHLPIGGSPGFSGESDDDHEELLTAANLACSSSVDACSSPFWKTVEPLFTSIGPEEKSFLSQQDDYVREEIEGSASLSFQRNGSRKVDNEAKEPVDGIELSKQLQISSPYGSSDAEKRFNVVTPLYQRVLSALILDEEIEDSEESAFGRSRSIIDEPCVFIDTGSTDMDRLDVYEPVFGVQTRRNSNPNVIFPCNGYMDRDRSPAAYDRACNGELLHRDGGYGHSEVDVLVRLSRQDQLESLHSNNGEISYINSQYEKMCLEEKLVLELQSVGLFLEAVPALNDKEDGFITQEMAHLEMEINEKISSKRKCLNKIQKAIQEGKDIERNPEQVAMDKLVELAYMKFPLQETKGNYASKNAKVSKQVALGFAKRTLARCRRFEVSGVSCFSEPALREIVYAPPPRIAESEMLSSANFAVGSDGPLAESYEANDHVVKTGPPFNRGGGAKGKRSERDRDGSGRNSIPKSGRLSLGSSKGERKTKSKPKHKTAQLSTPGNNTKLTDGNGGSGELAHNNNGSKRKDVRFITSGNNNNATAQESVEFGSLNDIDGIEELGVDSELGAPQDLNSWLNFDVDGIQDYDSIGLEIPMDDISQLNMF